jgi:TPR repeat protein
MKTLPPLTTVMMAVMMIVTMGVTEVQGKDFSSAETRRLVWEEARLKDPAPKGKGPGNSKYDAWYERTLHRVKRITAARRAEYQRRVKRAKDEARVDEVLRRSTGHNCCDVAVVKSKAEAGNATAQFNLGVMYDLGHGVAKDYAEAAKWYRKAAEQGYAEAQYNLGWMYANGEGVAKDYAAAAKWYRKAAERRR